MFGFKTIEQGQRVAVWRKDGSRELVDGPRRIFMDSQRVEALERKAAGPGEYLVVRFVDGRVEHVRGPAVVWMDRVEHASVAVEQAITLDANEAVVVYRQIGGDPGKIQRRVVHGPDLFVPASNEWLHSFSWHGADPKNHMRKVPRGLKFTKLRVIPDQMYFDVEEVRTSDDALLVIGLMLFFELADIETMLEQTHDPVADFINAVSADVIDFVAAHTFEQFKEKAASLNSLDTYPNLLNRSAKIGYQINKVVYRGYHATGKLQAMHDGAIEARTQLRLAAETQEQAQQLEDLKLAREAERAEKRRAIEEADQNHQNHLARLARSEALESEKQTREAALAHRRQVNREHLDYLRSMREIGIDVTRYMVARHEKPDKHVRVEGVPAGRFHLHES